MLNLNSVLSNLNLSYIVVVVVVITPILIKLLYNYLRQQFPAVVNCWFCNNNLSVPYHEQNNFTCTICKQYNGFTKDGDYNKPIPAQRDELLNHIIAPNRFKSEETSNGLCILCNNNQQLKIYQLAHFVPLNEDNYDIEIEHFQKQLDKAYKLCPACDRVVKETISKQNCIILGKQVEELRRSGATLLNRSTTGKMQYSKCLKYFTGCATAAIIVFVILFNTQALNWYKYKDHFADALDLIKEYSKELLFALGSSIITSVAMYTLQQKNTVQVKSEKKFRKLKKRTSTVSNCESVMHDASFSAFTSPLNSTSKSDDEKHYSRRLSSNQLHDSFGAKSQISDEMQSLGSSPSRASFFKSAPSIINLSNYDNASFRKADLSMTLGQLQLSARKDYNDLHQTRQILSPPKLRNPWTGKKWDCDVLSRSSSQSSGISSRPASIYDDDVSSILSLPRLEQGSTFGDIKNQSFISNTSSLFTTARSFKPINNINFS